MAATAVVSSSLSSTALQTLKCTHSKHCWSTSDHHFLRVFASIRFQQFASSSYPNSCPIEPYPVAQFSQRFRLSRIGAAVAEEEAAAAASAEEVGGGDEVSGGEAEAPVNTKLYFGNLPYHCDSAQLAGIIQEYGNPELIEVLYDRDTGRSRGFAFVTMSSIEDANKIIQNLDGTEYGGRTLRVNFSDRPRPKEPLYPETEHKLFVGNLSWSVTSESLTQVFQEYGNVIGARVLYDGETGRSRGYGFVCYSTKSELDAAIASLDGVELEGRSIRVSLAQGKKSYA